MKLTFLGTGTSHGVPVIACDCAVCKSKDPHNKRTRSSVYIEVSDNSQALQTEQTEEQQTNPSSKYILIDIGPDFHEQAIRENIRALDALLLTHSHADHIFGIDDLRSFSSVMSQKPENPQNEKYNKPPIPIYTNHTAAEHLKHSFSYLFSEHAEGGGHAKIDLHEVKADTTLKIGNATITPIPLSHGSLEATGWLLTENQKSIAYLTDCNYISDESIELIHKNCKTAGCSCLTHLIIDGLRLKEHPTHFNFLQALEAAGKIGGEHIWLTHLTHNSSHDEIIAYIEEHRTEFPELIASKTILPAYDGLVIET